MINKIAVICPTFGRPETFNQIYENWKENNTGCSEFFFVFEYSEKHLIDKTNATAIVAEPGTRGMVRPLNEAAEILCKEYTHLMFVGDDHRFRTPDWDKKFMEAFEEMGTGYVYCPEGYHNEKLATACAMSSDIVRALGYMALPEQKHLFVDVYWMRMMERIGKRYLPDVYIEHVHPNYGKAAHDAAYAAVNTNDIAAHDNKVYDEWLANQMEADVAKVKEATRKFYSQCGEDEWIFKNLDLPQNGVFVDIGANDPVNNSNTYAFEKSGWKGVAIDINFMFAPRWSKLRPFTDFYVGAAIGHPLEYPNCFTRIHAIEEHNFEVARAENQPVPEKLKRKPVNVASIDIGSFMRDIYGYVDLLSLDVEGGEFDILNAIFTQTSCRPRIIIAEHSTMWIDGKNIVIKQLCESHGYKTVHETALNYIFSL